MSRKIGSALAAALLLAACQNHKSTGTGDPPVNGSIAADAVDAPIVAPSAAAVKPVPTQIPQPPPTLADAVRFVPLASDQVKDAIHRALRTGQTQRWQDGELSGYAVPSTTTDAHGCRAVRYTVDQLRDAPPRSINACEG